MAVSLVDSTETLLAVLSAAWKAVLLVYKMDSKTVGLLVDKMASK